MRQQLNINFKTFKTSGVDAGSVQSVGTTMFIDERKVVNLSKRDFSAAAAGTGNGTIEDMKAGGNGSPINGIPVIGGPAVEIDGVAVKVAPFINDKCRLEHWRAMDNAARQLVKNYGLYYTYANTDNN